MNMYIYNYAYIYTHMICICIYLYVCVYIYTYVYINTYIHINLHMYFICIYIPGKQHRNKTQCRWWNCNVCKMPLQPTAIQCSIDTAIRHRHNSTIQHCATHCNALQHRHWKGGGGQRSHVPATATHCNTLQHTATHCNTLQHTATQSCEADSREAINMTYLNRIDSIILKTCAPQIRFHVRCWRWGQEWW